LTDAQVQALKQTLQSEKLSKTLLNIFLGFILGFASSLLANYISARWKQNKELQPES